LRAADLTVVTLTDKGAARVRGGLPWVYAADVVVPEEDTTKDVANETVELRDKRGARLGTGLWSPKSPIPVRLLGREAVTFDRALLEARLQAALARRRADGYVAGCEDDGAARLVHGEADALPGLVVDRYADVLVLQTTAPAMDRREPELAALLTALTGARLVVARDDGSARDFEALPRRSSVLFGRGPTTVRYRDAGSLVEVDVLTDGKTGGFLDQVENHAVATRYARGETLDAFTYHGGFALALCRGGATSVLAIDESATAIERARANAARNGYDQLRAEVGNAFDRLRALEGAGRRFDTVVIDPPALAKRKGRAGGRHASGVETALRAYKELNLRAFRLLSPGGVLVSCSCSGRVGVAEFGAMLEDAARDAGRSVQLLERRGAGRDHPVLLGVPETEYLKCFVMRVLT
jgi:23S rRNA (cytosine1962-C5)-methyltransferase